MAEVDNSEVAVVYEENEDQLQPLSRSAQADDEPQNKKKWAILSAIILLFLLFLEVALRLSSDYAFFSRASNEGGGFRFGKQSVSL